MWPRTTTSSSMIARDEKKLSTSDDNYKSLNVNEEYLHAFRTQSYVDFFSQAQLLFNNDEPSSVDTIEILLEPQQHLIPSILDSLVSNNIPSSTSSNLKLLFFRYFEISAQASTTCTKLLSSINETQANYTHIQRALHRFTHYSPDQFNSAISELASFSHLRNPFSDPNPADLKLICAGLTSLLQNLKSKRKKVAKRIKIVEYMKKAAGVSLTVACTVAALVAIGIAVHSISGILVGPAIVSMFPIDAMKKKTKNYLSESRSWSKCGPLKRVREQLDVAAKGVYTLNRDFDTMSRVIGRLRDEVEHKKEMIRFCLGRKEERFPLEEVVKELRKNGKGFKRQVVELEEHVWLCLVTINRARVLLIQEMAKTSSPC